MRNTANVPELGEYLAALFVNCLCHVLPSLNLFLVVQPGLSSKGQSDRQEYRSMLDHASWVPSRHDFSTLNRQAYWDKKRILIKVSEVERLEAPKKANIPGLFFPIIAIKFQTLWNYIQKLWLHAPHMEARCKALQWSARKPTLGAGINTAPLLGDLRA